MLVLGITVAGIAAVLFWGAPAIQQVQDAGAQQAVLNDFASTRQALLGLTVVDAATEVSIQSPSGTVGLVEGTSMMVVVDRAETTDTLDDCTMSVSDWAPDDTFGPTSVVATTATGACAGASWEADANGSCTDEGGACFALYRLVGASPAPSNNPDSLIAPVTNLDVGDDWLVQLLDETDTVLAQAWIFNTNALEWSKSGTETRTLALEHGAVLSSSGSGAFVEAQPLLQEQRFGNEDVLLRIIDLDASDPSSFSGRSNLRLSLSLAGQYARSTVDAWSVTYEWAGERAQTWCRTMDLRDPLILGLQEPEARYDQAAPPANCDGDTPRLRYIIDDLNDGVPDTDGVPDSYGNLDGLPDPFPFTLLHATYRADLSL